MASQGDGGGALRVTRVEEGRSGVEVVYSNGVREEIENGRYEQKDAAGRTVIERPATAADIERIRGNVRASGFRQRLRVPISGDVSEVEVGRSGVEVRYANGWKEELEAGRYELKDPNGNTVVERVATSEDLARMRAISGR